MTKDILEQLERVNCEVISISQSEDKRYVLGRFLPNTDVVFIAERPATQHTGARWNPKNNFYLSLTDKSFVKTLNTYGFGGCYITDVVKTCAPATRGDLDPMEICKFKNILFREIEAINPRLVVAIGESAFKTVNNFNDFPVPIYPKRINHPAILRFKKNVSIFEAQVKELRSFCDRLG